MAEVERVEVRRVEGTSEKSGPYTVIGLILGVLIVAGVALAIIGLPEIKAWWSDSGTSNTPAVTTTAQ